MNVEITSEQCGLVLQILHRELSDLTSEIRRTQTSEFRDELKDRERLLRDLCERLSRTE